MNLTDKYKDLFAGIGLDKKTSEHFSNLVKEAMNKINSTTLVGESGAGLVKITGRGDYKVVKVDIDPTIFKETEAQLVSDLFVAAMNDLQKKIVEAAAEVQYQLDLDLRAVLYSNTN